MECGLATDSVAPRIFRSPVQVGNLFSCSRSVVEFNPSRSPLARLKSVARYDSSVSSNGTTLCSMARIRGIYFARARCVGASTSLSGCNVCADPWVRTCLSFKIPLVWPVSRDSHGAGSSGFQILSLQVVLHDVIICIWRRLRRRLSAATLCDS